MGRPFVKFVKLTVHPLTPARWPDLEALFNARGCSIARGCWCMYYRESGKVEVPAGQTLAQARRDRLKALTDTQEEIPPGLIGYREPPRPPPCGVRPPEGEQGSVGRPGASLAAQPVGWVTLGPREDYAKLRRSPVMKPVDDAPVWSIVCFVVPAEFRGQGVAHELLQGAVAWAAKRGVKLLEAYPVDKPQRSHDEFLWHGAQSMFSAAGFEEVARRKPQRPVVRLALRPA